MKLVKYALAPNLKLEKGKANSIMSSGTHRLGRKKRSGDLPKPKPIIARFTCRADRDLAWRQHSNLKDSMVKIAEDLPLNVCEIRRTILIPALKKVRENEGTKATIIGDCLLVHGKKYMSNQIPMKWRSDVDGSHLAQNFSSPAMSEETRQAQEV